MQPNHERFLDLYRSGIRSASDIGQAWLQVSLRLHEKQLEAVRGMIDENTRSAERLGEARSIGELTSLHSQLAGSQIRRVAEFWSTLWRTAADGQQELFGQMQRQGGQARELATRTTEDVARAAANQVSRAAGSIRESAPAPSQHHGKEHRKSA